MVLPRFVPSAIVLPRFFQPLECRWCRLVFRGYNCSGKEVHVNQVLRMGQHIHTCDLGARDFVVQYFEAWHLNVCYADELSEGEPSTLVTFPPASLEAIGRRPLPTSPLNKWKKRRGLSPARPVLMNRKGLQLKSQWRTARMKKVKPWDWDDGNDDAR